MGIRNKQLAVARAEARLALNRRRAERSTEVLQRSTHQLMEPKRVLFGGLAAGLVAGLLTGGRDESGKRKSTPQALRDAASATQSVAQLASLLLPLVGIGAGAMAGASGHATPVSRRNSGPEAEAEPEPTQRDAGAGAAAAAARAAPDTAAMQ